ncbi:OmpA family protein [Flavobacterium sp. CYK-4]|uniref:OmpA family protein n=1 Tax=Flavobacterium lotistagni TaxID=2709660 RepID=UPI00140BD8D8|nr:OmpA family protein [Flavobacterium lotistagni]NHM06973.1 OmpA family protein [Flavobacterium lotistagni]
MKLVLSIVCVLFSAFVFGQQQFSVFFDSDKFVLNSKETKNLSDWIAANKEVKIVGIHGFTDEDGTSGYNDTLAKKRINSIFNLIKDQIKIRDDFKTRSFGELHQLSTTKAENRKVTLFYLEAKDIPRENEILGIKAPEKAEEIREIIRYPEKLALDNPDGTKSEYKLDVDFMKKLGEAAVGEKLKIENLNFKINTFIVVPESRGKMYELLVVLQKNPKLKIEIQGHLCCMPTDRLDLSTQRAKAINNFLVANGINEKRLTYKGFGSTQPIFPIPEKDEAQRAANRRVEILIVSH